MMQPRPPARSRSRPAARPARPRAARTRGRPAHRPADRGRPVEPHVRGHRRHRAMGRTAAAARPCAGHRARHEARAPGDQRAAPDGRAGAAAACCSARTRRARGALLRHGVRRGHARTAPPSSSPRSARSAPGTPCSAWSTPSSSCTRWTPQTVGLGDFGRPEGFLDRQLRRWGKQLDASRNRELAGIDELHAALGRALPALPRPDRRARRLPARQRPDRRRRPDQGHPRLGDVHARRPAHRPRACW